MSDKFTRRYPIALSKHQITLLISSLSNQVSALNAKRQPYTDARKSLKKQGIQMPHRAPEEMELAEERRQISRLQNTLAKYLQYIESEEATASKQGEYHENV